MVWREPGVIIRRVLFAAGWREPASSAIIYNIVKVKVTCWPVDPFDPLTRRPVDPFDPLTRRPVNCFEKEPLKAIARSTYLHRWDVTRLTRWPVDPSTRWHFRKRTPQGQLQFAPTYSVEMQYSKRCRIRLCCLLATKEKAPLQRVAWGWRIYNIVESESDPSTRWPFQKRTPQGQMGGPPTYTHQVWRRSVKGPRRTQGTNKQTLLELWYDDIR